MASDKVEAEAEAELMWPKLHCLFLINTELLSPLRIINCLCWLHSPQQRQKSTSHYFSIWWLSLGCWDLSWGPDPRVTQRLQWLQVIAATSPVLVPCPRVSPSRCPGVKIVTRGRDSWHRGSCSPHTLYPGEKFAIFSAAVSFPSHSPDSLTLAVWWNDGCFLTQQEQVAGLAWTQTNCCSGRGRDWCLGANLALGRPQPSAWRVVCLLSSLNCVTIYSRIIRPSLFREVHRGWILDLSNQEMAFEIVIVFSAITALVTSHSR